MKISVSKQKIFLATYAMLFGSGFVTLAYKGFTISGFILTGIMFTAMSFSVFTTQGDEVIEDDNN